MVVAGLVLAGVAALIHVYIFILESLLWMGPRARAVFGLSPEQAGATRELAFNQGFYNLLLAVIAGLGIVLMAVGATPVGATLVFAGTPVGATLVFAGTGSMVAAGLVLLVSSPSKWSAALTQLAAPLLAVVLLAVGLAL
ncbi:DUF1304 domain-containing protein [Sinomonas sp. ASV322]|uniref:DUF1304 domain-containing protein n=1 Tax=Sinomonas sp. ASV322 TaxID=3041920 RepID=UPI0027DACE97|nr:DUF1304 domain-containing protein [Sinomonas sp. ASV322]MDQ4504084.1 DUF1304 domain-containing protein [Sinomonas sp. ASV322]